MCRLKIFNVLDVVLLLLLERVQTQEPTVLLNQGSIVGVTIFPESSRIPINAFLGIPYATPPIGRLRFSAPEKHKGWKRTLYAQESKPGCVQMTSGNDRSGREDCLYLNVWAPQNAQRSNNLMPVLLVLFSQTFSEDSPVQLPGQDLAGQGLIVVTANYRLNIFGFLSLESPNARGNFGLLDQYFVMLWIKENIGKFGGDAAAVTLLGHSAGATSVLYHMISPRTKSLFHRAIMMSGNIISAWRPSNVTVSSKLITSLLGCSSDTAKESVQCLRDRTVEDIAKAFRTQNQSGNWSNTMMPVIDTFLTQNDRYLPLGPMEALLSGNFHQIPLLIGLTSLEAADSKEQWEGLARQGYHQLRHYVDYTAIPDVMATYKLKSGAGLKYMKEIIKWKYIDEANEGDAWSLLRQLQRLYSEALFDSPHEKLISLLVKTSQPLYVYRYHQVGGVDLSGKKSNSSGASHGSDLPYLFGPTLFQQLVRRRMTAQEEQLSKRMRIMWSEFVKFGYPTPARQYDAWRIYTKHDNYIKQIGESNIIDTCQYRTTFWNTFLPKLSNLSLSFRDTEEYRDRRVSRGGNETVRHAMYTLLGLVVALVALLVVCVVLLKRAAKERRRERDTGSF